MTQKWTHAERLAAEVLASGSEDALRDLLAELDRGPPAWTEPPKRRRRTRKWRFRPAPWLDRAAEGAAVLVALVAIAAGSRPLLTPVAEARPAITEALGQVDLPAALRPATSELAPAAPIDRTVTSREPISLMARDLEATIGRYREVAAVYAERKLPCEQLRAAYLEVEDLWTRYSIARGRLRDGAVPENLAAWDAALYESVRGVDRDFNASGCNRP